MKKHPCEPIIGSSRTEKLPTGTEISMVVASGCGEKLTRKGQERSFWGHDMFFLFTGALVIQMCTFVKLSKLHT